MRSLFFDVDGVLVYGYHARVESRKCWDENIERDFSINRERFQKEFIFGPFIREVIVGKQDLKAALAVALPTLGFSGDPQTFIAYWLKNDAILNYDLLEKVQLLKQSGRAKLFIATNQEHNRARYLMDDLGLKEYFEDIFYSARVGHLKPTVEYFRHIARELKLSDGDTPVLFDDSPDVVAAATAFGWDAVQYLGTEDLFKSAAVSEILRRPGFDPPSPVTT
jgi:putative hydrolase of the HAD superfamily